jgi:hypothetical protein
MLVAGAILVAAEFVHPAFADPPTRELTAPAPVRRILERGCYDCHSDQTRWPWYSRVPPISFWIRREVDEGRQRLNFSAWTDYASDPGSEDQKLDEIARLLKSGAMPPWYYAAMHPDARLSDSERAAITRWIADEKSADEKSAGEKSSHSGARDASSKWPAR